LNKDIGNDPSRRGVGEGIGDCKNMFNDERLVRVVYLCAGM
jgi:hypothetical protein